VPGIQPRIDAIISEAGRPALDDKHHSLGRPGFRMGAGAIAAMPNLVLCTMGVAG